MWRLAAGGPASGEVEQFGLSSCSDCQANVYQWTGTAWKVSATAGVRSRTFATTTSPETVDLSFDCC